MRSNGRFKCAERVGRDEPALLLQRTAEHGIDIRREVQDNPQRIGGSSTGERVFARRV